MLTTWKWNRLGGRAHVGLCLAILGIGLMPRASADVSDKKTIVTFSAPVEIPGKVLPSGTYVFKLLDSPTNRNIVQILDKDEQHLYATVLGIPDYRAETPDKPLIQFEETPANSLPALKSWYYPGDNYGVQFVYPHDRAVELAKRTNQNVLSMRNEMAKHITTPAKSASDPSVQALGNTEVTGVNPAGETIAIEVVAKPKTGG